MKEFISFILAMLLVAVAQGQSSQCNNACIVGTTDNFQMSTYGKYFIPYVHSPSQPHILTPQSASITTGIIALHGNSRDVNDYYCWMTWAVQAALGSIESTYIAAPHYMLAEDNPPTNAMYWDGSTSWMSGGKSSTAQSTRTASFQILDDLMTTFANKTLFPGLTQILFIGHSAGGQAGQRYALVTSVDSTIANLNVKLRYIFANPGSYAYLDGNRPVLALPPPNVCTGFCDASTIPTATYTFAAPSADVVANCTDYNEWKYGLDDRSVYSWTNKLSAATVQANFKNKNITYMLGTDDTCNNQFGSCDCDDVTLDNGCEGDLQGYCRFQRGWAFYNYLQNFYGTKVHSIVNVPGVGHDACNMYNGAVGLSTIFDVPITSVTTTTASTATTGAVATTSTTGSATTGSASTTGDASTTGVSTTGSRNPNQCAFSCIVGDTDEFHLSSYGAFSLPYIRSPQRPSIQSPQNSSITTGILVIHGDSRDANDYYCWMTWAVQAGFNLDNAYIIAPHYQLLTDGPAANEMYWDSGNAWMSGGKSSTAQATRTASFQILDDILTVFANKTIFPGLSQILVVGHSAGAQMIQRYALVTSIDPVIANLHVELKYVLANSGSYAYLDTKRPVLAVPPALNCTGFCDSATIPTTSYVFETPSNASVAACTDYNEWKYGLDDRSVDSWTNKLSATQVQANYPGKDIVYLLGTDDTCNNDFGSCGCVDESLDTGCEAIMQGYCRFQRGWAFYSYLQQFYAPATPVHTIVNVPGIDHDACNMFFSFQGLNVMFGTPIPATTATATTSTTAASTTTASTGAASTTGGTVPPLPVCTANCAGQTDIFQMTSYKSFTFSYVHSPSQPPILSPQSSSITTGIIVVHDESRNASEFFCLMSNSVQLGSNPASSYIVAPHFMLLADAPPTNGMYWDANTAWQNGGKSTTAQSTRVASYQIIDDMITTFGNKTLFPGLSEVLVYGDSMGASLVQRYALVSTIDTTAAALGVSIRYVAANAGSYAYLDTTRPVLDASATCDNYCDASTIPTAAYSFAVPSTAVINTCPGYNQWEYGLDTRSVDSYTNKLSAAAVLVNYQPKDVTYLLGTADTCNEDFGCGNCNDASLDNSCEGVLQGNCRFQRGWAFFNHLQHVFNTTVHAIANVPGVGHVPCDMLSSSAALSVLFPSKPTTATTAAATSTTAAATTSTTAATSSTATTAAATTSSATTSAATTSSATTSAATTSATTSTATTGSTSTTGVPINPCASSITISQSFVTGWSSGSTSFSQWNVVVSTTTLPVYDIDLLFTFAPGAAFSGFWQIQQVSGNVYEIIDWRFQSGLPVPANTQLTFGYIVSSASAATITVSSARCTSAIVDCHVSSSLSLVSSSNNTCGELQQVYQFSFTNLGTSTTSAVQTLVNFPAHSRPTATSGLVTADSAAVIILNQETTFTAPVSIAPGSTATVGFTLSVPTYNSLLPGYASVPTYQVTSTQCA